MADEFVTIPLDTDPDTLFQDDVDRIQQQWPDWEPNPGNLETVMMLGKAFMFSSLAVLAASMPEEAFQQAGKTLFNLPPFEAAPAAGESTWIAIDEDGYEIDAGTKITIPETGDELHAFEVLETVVIPPASKVTGAGEVKLRAVILGEVANDLTADPDPVDALDWIDKIELVGNTSGGADAETVEEYSNRLRKMLRLLAPRPIIPPDFEIAALQVPWVVRSLAIDGWDPELETGGHERKVTVAVIDESGNDGTAEQEKEVDDYLQAKREVNFEVFVVGSDKTAIDISLKVSPLPGFSDAGVKVSVEDALEKFLDPANYGLPTFGDPSLGGGWRKVEKVRINDVVAVVENTQGVDFSEEVKIAKAAGTKEAKDLTLAGAAPLTEVGTLTVTVI